MFACFILSLILFSETVNDVSYSTPYLDYIRYSRSNVKDFLLPYIFYRNFSSIIIVIVFHSVLRREKKRYDIRHLTVSKTE